jgi:hypothetical protein
VQSLQNEKSYTFQIYHENKLLGKPPNRKFKTVKQVWHFSFSDKTTKVRLEYVGRGLHPDKPVINSEHILRLIHRL